MKSRLMLPALLAMSCCACVTHIRPTATDNPPPQEALSAFQHFQLQPVVATTAEVREQNAAMAKIAANVQRSSAIPSPAGSTRAREAAH